MARLKLLKVAPERVRLMHMRRLGLLPNDLRGNFLRGLQSLIPYQHELLHLGVSPICVCTNLPGHDLRQCHRKQPIQVSSITRLSMVLASG